MKFKNRKTLRIWRPRVSHTPADDQELAVVCNKIQIKDSGKGYPYSIIYNIKYSCGGNTNGIIYQCSQKAEMESKTVSEKID